MEGSHAPDLSTIPSPSLSALALESVPISFPLSSSHLQFSFSMQDGLRPLVDPASSAQDPASVVKYVTSPVAAPTDDLGVDRGSPSLNGSTSTIVDSTLSNHAASYMTPLQFVTGVPTLAAPGPGPAPAPGPVPASLPSSSSVLSCNVPAFSSPPRPSTPLPHPPHPPPINPSLPLAFNNTAHAATSLAAIEEMRKCGNAVDLTLGFDDGAVLQCHRVVLGAASAFFRSFFAANASVTSIISMPKIQIENAGVGIFKRLLDYAYTGRIDITREELPFLSDVAHAFGFKEVESICRLASEKFRFQDQAKNENGNVKVVETPSKDGKTRKKSLVKTPLYGSGDKKRGTSSEGDAADDKDMWMVPGNKSGPRRQRQQREQRKPKRNAKKSEEEEEDVEFVEALCIVLREFERKLPSRAAVTMRKWKEEPYAEKQIGCSLCDQFITGVFEDYIQHIWENRDVHNAFKKGEGFVEGTNEEEEEEREEEGVSKRKNGRQNCRTERSVEAMKENRIPPPASNAVVGGADRGVDITVETTTLHPPPISPHPLIVNSFDKASLSERSLGLFSCRHCDEMFVTKALRHQHRITRHSAMERDRRRTEEERTCLVCGKIFRNNYTKRLHYSHVHEGVRLAKKACPECGKLYSHSGLRVHRARDHAGVRKRCPDCPDDAPGGNLFKDATALWVHRQRRHSTKRYRCAICFKDFCLKTSWRYHYDVVHGGKRWKCQKCGKNFHAAHALKRHLNDIHLGRAHVCPECGKKFSQRSKLELHVREHRGDFARICFCGQGFMLKRLYMAHLVKKHGIDVDNNNTGDEGHFVISQSRAEEQPSAETTDITDIVGSRE